ncbi:MAG: SpvB/TcaC N-terminal domain-containing protein [Candidatus Omnitrophota bacterium]
MNKILIILFFLVLPFADGYAEEASVPLTPSLSQSYQTDLMTGAAVVNVPITVPPGRKGIQPAIALRYSSSNPNGICGVGWSLELGAIQRNTKRGVPRYDSSDSFTANVGGAAMELVSIGSGEYRAKQEGAFMKFSFNGTSWQVRDQTGSVYLFGTSPDSRQADNGYIFKWGLDKVTDIHGNYMSLSYVHDGNEVYPEQILYTGKEPGPAPIHSVNFIYENRNDVLSSYRSAFEVSTAKRLSTIDISTQGDRVRKYVIQYIYSAQTSRSLLSAVTTYGRDGASSLPPVTFEYQSGSVIGE